MGRDKNISICCEIYRSSLELGYSLTNVVMVILLTRAILASAGATVVDYPLRTHSSLRSTFQPVTYQHRSGADT